MTPKYLLKLFIKETLYKQIYSNQFMEQIISIIREKRPKYFLKLFIKGTLYEQIYSNQFMEQIIREKCPNIS